MYEKSIDFNNLSSGDVVIIIITKKEHFCGYCGNNLLYNKKK